MIAATIVATTIYLLLTIAALLSIISPVLQSLSSHGKTRLSLNNNECKNKITHTHHKILQRLQHFVLTSPILTVNKCRFIDFYATGIITTILLVLLAHASALDGDNRSILQWSDVSLSAKNHNYYHRWSMMIPTLLLLTHLIRRYFECEWVQKSSSSSQMHLAGYLLGILHYICLPIVLVPLPPYSHYDYDVTCTRSDAYAVSSNPGVKSNEEVCDTNSSFDSNQYTSTQIIVDITAIIGCIYFQYQQHRHHVILANIRKDTKTESTQYAIPIGGWFEYTSCPHYFSEIMIYFMFAILLNNKHTIPVATSESEAWFAEWNNKYLNIQSTLFVASTYTVITMYKLKHWILLVWVTTNLSISANTTHKWYIHNYGATYPQRRRRLIPFVW